MKLSELPRGCWALIHWDGTESLNAGPISLDDIRKLIGAETLEFVPVGRAIPNDVVMVIDDRGYESRMVDHGDGRMSLEPVRARKPVNAKATKHYHAICKPGTTHQIVGDVILLHDADFR